MGKNIDIYVDCIVFNLQKIGGISVYFGELIRRLIHSEYDVKYIEQKCISNNFIRNKFSIPAYKILVENSLFFKISRYLPIRLKLNNKSIIHSSYYRICNNAFAANIVTVYDFNYEYGHVRRGLRKYIHCRQKKIAVEKADGVICISESTKHDLLQLYKGINPHKIKVIHLAASEDFFNIPKAVSVACDGYNINNILMKKYILFVGARSHHKNFNVCVDTLVKLPEYELVIVGARLTAEETSILDSKIPLKYHALINVSAVELNYLYNYAFCLLYPSSYEGFGIPLLEGMQAGCPVVSTNVSSLPEVAGNAGLLADSICPEAFYEKITSLEDASYRDKVINAGFENAKNFTWEKTYQETVEFYQEVFNNKFG